MQALPIFRCFLSILVVLVPSLYGKTTLLKKQTLPLSRLQTPTQSPAQEYKISEEKEWNIFVYMAGRNDLFFAIDQNLAQLMSVSFGSLCNIIVQVDKFGTSDVVRAHIKNGVMSPYWRASDTSTLERNKNPRLYNSGAVENFIDFLQTGMTQFKAKKQCVVIWDHGSGCFDPLKWRSPICRPDEEIISQTPTRGMAFNDTYNYYLSNQDLTYAFETISRTILDNQKIAMLCFDICHGGQLELAAQVNHVVGYIVASEEVELASGWNYAKAFGKLTTEVRSEIELGGDVVKAYKETYLSSADYTLALYDLSSKPEGKSITYFELLTQSIDALALALQALLRCPEKKFIEKLITDVRTKKNLFCEFYDNEYIDLHLFLLNLQNNLRQLLNQKNFRYDYPDSTVMVQEAIALCLASLELLYKVVPIYTAGIAFMGNPIRARGMSITFPLRSLHWSYTQTAFAQKTHWFDFVKECGIKRSQNSPCIF